MKIKLSLYGRISTSENASVNHMGNLRGEIKFSHDTYHAAEQGNSDSQVFFVRRSQQAKLGVCCPGHKWRNTVHFLAFDGCNKEKENLSCPCCSFELHAIKTSVWTMKFRALFHFRDLAVYVGSHSFQLLTALAAGYFGFRDLEKLVRPTQAHQRLWCFLPILNFWKITNGRIRKQMYWQILIPWVNNILQNRL